jgi:hypothetical protein
MASLSDTTRAIPIITPAAKSANEIDDQAMCGLMIVTWRLILLGCDLPPSTPPFHPGRAGN